VGERSVKQTGLGERLVAQKILKRLIDTKRGEREV
jgi:hypothetical protein